jgi:hypothetical protein
MEGTHLQFLLHYLRIDWDKLHVAWRSRGTQSRLVAICNCSLRRRSL